MPNHVSSGSHISRTLPTFTSAEWDALVALPGRVVVAATNAVGAAARHPVGDGIAGIEAIAAGRGSGSALVRDIVAAIYLEDRPEPAALAGLSTPVVPAADTGALRDCRLAAELLAARARREDSDSYRQWIQSIATRVCHAASTDPVFGAGRPRLTCAERAFLGDLADALRPGDQAA